MHSTRHTLVLAVVLALLSTACRQEQASVREREPEPATEPTPDAPVAALERAEPTLQPPARTEPIVQPTALSWGGSGELEAFAATLVLDALGKTEVARGRRVSLFGDLHLSPDADVSELVDVLPKPRDARRAEALRTALAAASQTRAEPLDAASFQAALAVLTEPDADGFLTGARQLRLAHGLRALRAGAAPGGTSAFGLLYAPACPGADWLASVAALGPTGELPMVHDAAIDAALRDCWAPACPDLGASDDLAAALAACEAVALPAEVATDPVLAHGRGLLGALTVALVAADAGAIADADVDAWLDGRALRFDPPIATTALPASPLRNELTPRPDGWIAVDTAPTDVQPWPILELRDGRLQPAPPDTQAHDGGTVGLVAPAATPMGTLRKSLRATRDDDDATLRTLAVRGRDGRLQWVAIDSSLAVVADVLVRQDDADASLSVWLDPGRVDPLQVPADLTADDPRLTRIESPDGLAGSLLALHELLQDQPVSRVILDLRDTATTGELMAMVDVIDVPRQTASATTASALLAAPARDDQARPRLETLVVTEHRTAPVIQPAVPRPTPDSPQDTPP